MTTSVAKRHHTVPRLYLKQFAVNAKNQLAIYDKIQGRGHMANLDDACVQRNFYSGTEGIVVTDWRGVRVASDTYVESDLLNAYETDFSEMLREFCRYISESKYLDRNWKADFSIYVALCWFRSTKYRDRCSKLPRLISESITGQYAAEKLPSSVKKYQEVLERAAQRDSQKQHVQSFLTPVLLRYGYAVAVRRWTVFIATDGYQFCTSDNPVVLVQHGTGLPMLNHIEDSGVIIQFPLSPECLLVCHDDTIGWNHLSERILYLTPNGVHRYNWLQYANAERQFILPWNDFGFAEDLQSLSSSELFIKYNFPV